MLLKEETIRYQAETLSKPDAVAKIAFEIIKTYDEEIEHFFYFCLNSKNEIISITKTEGDIRSVRVSVRQLVKTALLHNATAIILAHNHPGGSLKASCEDLALTKKIKETCALFDIVVFDHVILATEKKLFDEEAKFLGFLSLNAENLI
jgi:DNA repair protein RadC